ncbi:hypothetical protein EMPG_11111 [Blastomyces silverae]|uniref:DUF676 domain-containing protein n=1 Tax=Blastomyces silverae TaxID=2060906 RepID=A0A0H1B1V2_9EURO|nr:hypothetical protein EMPG_11111 [Blastomyces silverae]
MWPRDLLAPDFHTARILTFGYDADVMKVWEPTSSNQILDNGKALAFAVLAHRQDDAATRPIIFVAHSLGGIVCESALLLCEKRGTLRSVFTSTIGVIFMGTPHHGSSLAGWGHNFARYLGAFRRTNAELVGSLRLGNSELGQIAEDFQHLIRREDVRVRVRVFCFYETLPMHAVGMVVERFSAVLSAYDNLPLDADHRNMTKFDSTANPGYRKVHGLLTRWLADCEPGSNAALNNPESPDRSKKDTCRAQEPRGGIVFNGNITGHNVVTGLSGDINLTFN